MNMTSKIITGLLSVSLVFNGVLMYTTMKEFDKKDKKYQVDIAKKDKTIGELKTKMEQISLKNDTNPTDSNKENTNPLIDLQNQYKEVSKQFIHAYLNYSVKNKNERRDNLLKMTDKKVVDMVSPETEDLGDPNFKSTINQSALFIDTNGDISKKCSVLIDVDYTIEGLENRQTKIKSLIRITLEKQGNEIKVVDYSPYRLSR
ncbi:MULTISPECIES: hypothetical protein [Bacillus cereus group]|uniref:Uncharacterized protein n=1 Tax=Bacillus cereus TaxID=1396 RepID=A0A1Q4L4F3_BACCE|nr:MULTISPECIES: hypothetical protein [Bacillus cereus group]EJP83528.1 hypothetical protein IAU_05508 [Bacillus cereus IS075]EOO82403.1 hypothetical protein IGS_05760 [Bacillus cereus IS845/00]EOO92594.1 hypothetical protein IGQ_05801 [Bacillus cereus IS195]MDX5927827.1 hypothetical protein [Bacillus cereus group sp. BfR-BA-00967]MDX5975040.1 hypothetical protein [Bacillus cereus group sp. BfR-BA-00287]